MVLYFQNAAAMEAASKVALKKLTVGKSNLLKTPGGFAAWEAFKGASGE